MVIVWDELPTQHCGYWKLEIKLTMQMYFGEISRYLIAKTWIANIQYLGGLIFGNSAEAQKILLPSDLVNI